MTETIINECPNNWNDVNISALGEIVSGGTPSRGNRWFWNGDIRWVTPTVITALKDKWLSDTPEHITEAGLRFSSAKLLPPQSIVVTTRATLGARAITKVALSTNQGFKSIIPNAETEPLWCYYIVETLQREMERRAVGTTFAEISKSDFATIPLCRPPKPEQARIAEILDIVDSAVRETEMVLAKVHQIKIALLHDLLLYGLNEHGQMRDPISRSEQFQNSPLGIIPKSWSARIIGDLANHVRSGVTPTGGGRVYTRDGVVFLRSQNVAFEGLSLKDVAFIGDKTHAAMARSEIFPFDVLLNITGASIGRCCYVPAGFRKANVNQHVCAIRLVNPCREDAALLAAILGSSIGQSQIEKLNIGSNRQGLNYPQIRSIVVPWPEPEERKEIVVRLEKMTARIEAEDTELSKLKQLKAGLSHDLLTGEVRVPITTSVPA